MVTVALHLAAYLTPGDLGSASAVACVEMQQTSARLWVGPGSQGEVRNCEEKGDGRNVGVAALSDTHKPSLRDLKPAREGVQLTT